MYCSVDSNLVTTPSRGFVPRSRTIEVEYTRRDGQHQRQELTDFVARIFQHEYDHLEGIVFLASAARSPTSQSEA